MGQGLYGALTVATAEALGVTPDRVMVVTGDTATCPWDVGTHASRGAFTACNAVIMAAEKARKRVFELAAEHFLNRVKFKLEQMKKKDPGFEIPDLGVERQLEPEDFDLRENFVFLKSDPKNRYLRLTLDEIIREAHFKEQGTMIVTEAFYDPCNQMIDMKTCRGNLSATYIFGAQGAEVEVDLETGHVKILKYVAAHDVGKVINRHTILGQIYGGGVQGLGYALSEEYKRERGRLLNPNFLDYKILSANDLNFPFEVELVETMDQEGPFGAKGVGEPGLVAVAPAIANAIYDATGIRVTSLPITPEKLALAIRAKAVS
jgi:xanthine dehydrogenase molybdenum-binding subunit